MVLALQNRNPCASVVDSKVIELVRRVALRASTWRYRREGMNECRCTRREEPGKVHTLLDRPRIIREPENQVCREVSTMIAKKGGQEEIVTWTSLFLREATQRGRFVALP
jgi:hypothetical protein